MLTLRAGDSSLVLAPELGGAIAGWTLGATPLLRRPLPEAIVPGSVRGLASFPLVPFSNRIGLGRFRWDGSDYKIERNFGDHPHAIHGVGWQSRWSVAAVSDHAATLTLMHDNAARWPFAFAAEQRFTLLPDRLQIALAMTNRHASDAPAGLGLHPYFPRRHGSVLQFAAERVWRNGDDMLPAESARVPPDWDHAAGLAVGTAALDNCFAGWNGKARITATPDDPVISIEAGDIFDHLVVFTPPGSDFFCVEPVSHMNDAINRGEPGMRRLAPGATLHGEVVFRLG